MSDISVIVCCYNSSYQLALNTLISIENQKEVAFDVVITDDGSKNLEVLLLKKWIEDNNIKNVYFNLNDQNRGTVKNILSAIPFCKSNYIKLISPGDYLYDEFSLKHYLDAFKNQNATIVTGKYIYYTENGDIVPTPFPISKKTRLYKYMKRNIIAYGDNILGASLAYKKEFLVKNLDKISHYVKYLEDFPLISICLLEGEIIYFDDHILIWYETGTGISTKKQGNNLLADDWKKTDIFLNENFTDKCIDYRLKRSNCRKWPKFKKIILYPLAFPGYFSFLLEGKFGRKPVYEKDMSKMSKIIHWEK